MTLAKVVIFITLYVVTSKSWKRSIHYYLSAEKQGQIEAEIHDE